MERVRYALVLAVLVSSLVRLGAASPKPDFAVPARMTGVASGSLDSTGNVVLNTNRVLNVLGQFQSITEWLYSLQTPELYQLASNFRAVMDSLVESGSPIFQGLSNAARISSGDISTTFAGIQRSINATIALNDQHQALLNGTQLFLGSAGVGNFSAVLDLLVRNVGNLSAVLDEIEPAIVDIQRLPRPTQALVDSMYPKDAVRRLNANLQEYVNVGTSTVPQINAVVNRVRLVDSFISRLSSVATLQQSNLNNSMRAVNGSVYTGVRLRLQNAVRAIRTSFSGSMATASRKLRPFTVDEVTILRQVAQNSTGLLDGRQSNVTQTLDVLTDRVQVRLAERMARGVLNRTVDAITNLAWRFALSVTSAVPRADTCFSRYNYEFDKIPRLIYGSLEGCGQDELRTLQTVAGALVGYLGVLQAQLDAEARNYNQCLNGLSATSSYELKLQRSVCLWGAHRFSELIGGIVVDSQVGAFQEQLQDEMRYSAARYHECLHVVDQLSAAEVVNLSNSIVNCLNNTAT
uniref:Uncharacterized protein n=1 Tax=Anopheles atroparvus TaxID=41427 RepID=A0AAG5D6P8_ANOAO